MTTSAPISSASEAMKYLPAVLPLMIFLPVVKVTAIKHDPSPHPVLILPKEDLSPHLEEEILFYSDALGFDSTVVLRISYTLQMEDNKVALIRYAPTEFSSIRHTIVIYLNRRSSRIDQSMSLAHEMIHAAQYVQGDLIRLSERSFMWKGKIYSDITKLRYKSRPWEVEAIATGAVMRKHFLKARRPGS